MSKKKLRDEKLQLSTENIIEILPVAIIVQDKDGLFAYANKAAERLLGVPCDQIIGRSYLNPPWKATTLDGKPLSRDDHPFARVIKERKPVYDIRQVIEKPDGSRIIVSINASPCFINGGPISGVVLTISDITEYGESEQRLKEERDYAESIIQTIREPLLVLDADLRVVTANQSFYKTFKVTEEETKGRLIYELGNRQWDIPKLKELLESIISRNTQFSDFEVAHDFSTIGPRIMLLNARQIKRENRPSLILLAIEDITESRQAKFSDALNRIDMIIHSILYIDERMQRAIAQSTEVLGCDQAHVYLREDKYWVLRYAHGLPQELIGTRYTDEQVPITTLAAQAKKPVIISDAYTDERVDRALMEAHGIRAFIAAPLIIQDNVIGMLGFVFQKGPTILNSTHINFIARLAASVSLALENARLYREQHRIADTLQKSLLVMPEHVAGVDFGYTYHSATEAAQVGGDFYDIFELEHGRVGVVIGDIAGKGVEAAVLTSVVKNAIKAYAFENSSPAAVLSKTNELIMRVFSPGYFVTVFLGILNLSNHVLIYCSAGHPAAIVKRAENGTDVLAEHSPVIGAFAGMKYTDSATKLARHDILFLYTDGLIEARRDHELFTEKRLIDFIGGLRDVSARELPDIVFRAVMDFTGGRLTDDVAILAVGI
ncbi:MAG: SpoIIE family protein phosphatase [Firmicutes bacterium]|nr:SpoIIE family protein phosphatase [Bacillota bacterium]